MKLRTPWLLALALTLLGAPAGAITVSKVISNAKSFANHKWTATSANAKVTCYANYVSPFLTKYGLGTHVGLPYDYANWVTLAQFAMGRCRPTAEPGWYAVLRREPPSGAWP